MEAGEISHAAQDTLNGGRGEVESAQIYGKSRARTLRSKIGAYRQSVWAMPTTLMAVLLVSLFFFFTRLTSVFQETENHEVADQPGARFNEFHRVSLRFDFSDIVRRTPSANPAAAAMKSKMACGMTTVANRRCVSTGSRFWTTMIATKTAKTEAMMSFKSRIGV
jgi:hypothetical protein